ncbi:MAG: nuclear transport factor 2 family protein [Vicinamibacterales bacterium]
MDHLLDELVKLERGALDRWITLDPEGYLSLYDPDVTYFDPTAEARIDGREAMRTRLARMKDLHLPFTAPRYEMIGASVQQVGEAAVLTFNLVNYGTMPGEGERQDRACRR